jgi:hypothetical protein
LNRDLSIQPIHIGIGQDDRSPGADCAGFISLETVQHPWAGTQETKITRLALDLDDGYFVPIHDEVK